jgi:hypothetical protein
VPEGTMPSWKIHKKWGLKLGIPAEVSDYIQKAIDSKGSSDKKIPMPEDFKQHTEDRKLQRSRGKNFAIADLNTNLHDRGKAGGKTIRKIIQEEDLKFLLAKGDDYAKAYYLHFILDYLDHSTNRQLIQMGDSITRCIDRYKKNKGADVPEVSQHLTCVMDFLKSHSQEVKKDLDI